MPRYHFPIIDGVRVFDPEGVTLPDARPRSILRGRLRAVFKTLLPL